MGQIDSIFIDSFITLLMCIATEIDCKISYKLLEVKFYY